MQNLQEEVLQDILEVFVSEQGEEVLLLEWGFLEDVVMNIMDKTKSIEAY